jgi:CheY-like chemotaxis protein
MAKTRVLVVEDSRTVREHLLATLAADPQIEVVGRSGGRETWRSSFAWNMRPDVITMDMMLPVMSGLAATEYIMAHCPTPILIVSSSVNRGELFKTYEALAAGAVDVIDKMTGRGARGRLGARLPGGDEAGGQDPGHHPSARPRSLSSTRLASRRHRRPAVPNREIRCWSPSALRPAARPRSSRCCAALPPDFPTARPVRAAYQRAVRGRVRRLARRPDAPARRPTRTTAIRSPRRRGASSWRPAGGTSSCATGGCG